MAKQKKAQEVSAVRQAKHGWIITLLFTVYQYFGFHQSLWCYSIHLREKPTYSSIRLESAQYLSLRALKPSRMVCQGFSVAH